jgi:DNA-directed RNA polymerase I subunit RPA1
VQNEFDSVRQGLLRKANNSGYEVASEFLGYSSTDKVDRPEVRQGLGQAVRDPDEATTWDNLMKKQMSSMTTDIIKETMKGQVKKFPWNNLTLMTTSGAKGSMVNVSQICCLLGTHTQLTAHRTHLTSNTYHTSCQLQVSRSSRASVCRR